ncbi:hypothetical protein EDD85DRAFT_845925 [Armillaria nabsnona]|nr:hypothetical protein EDD85DRAFT_845925 [Armillaria nabsnona]
MTGQKGANTTTSSAFETRTALPEAYDHTEYSEPPSPLIHSLPPEILSEIFLLAIKDSDPYNILDLLADGPRLLEKVCLRWYDIVWGCAALWSTFKVDEAPRPKEIGPKLLLDALQRTGQSELSFTIHLSNTPRPIAMESLVQHSMRWKEVSLRHCQLASWNIFPNRHYSRAVCVPSLKSLTVKGQGLHHILAMFRDAPNLTSLHLRILDEPIQFFGLGSIQVRRWSQIKHLSMLWYLPEYSAEPILDFLWSCPGLETLEEKTPSLPDFEAGFTPLTLSRLRLFSVWSPQLLHYLDCPVLQTLELTLSADVVDPIHLFEIIQDGRIGYIHQCQTRKLERTARGSCFVDTDRGSTHLLRAQKSTVGVGAPVPSVNPDEQAKGGQYRQQRGNNKTTT